MTVTIIIIILAFGLGWICGTLALGLCILRAFNQHG